MTSAPSHESVQIKAERLRALHAGPALLVLPNAWDAASARALVTAGFGAIAATSGGVAPSLGFSDHEGAPVGEMLAAAARIIGAVDVPVTVDFESGYGLSPREIAERLIAIGAAGLNLEDSDHRCERRMLDAEYQAQRISDLKATARTAGVGLVINARVDVFILRLGTPEEQLAEGVRRARLYREAGADCVYPILLSDEHAIRSLVEAAGVININVRRGGPISLAKAAELGVRRVSYATSIFREAMAAVERLAADIKAESDALPLKPSPRPA
jgi:2-methylisocitrate lyase-like PEP mutase family enzyme